MSKNINDLLIGNEYALFLQTISDVADVFPDVVGILAVGTLIQPNETPYDYFVPRYRTPRGLAYEKIRNPGRRRLGVRESSDFDIWICLKDTDFSTAAQQAVETGAIALLDELAGGILTRGTQQWSLKKRKILGTYYKNRDAYPSGFAIANGDEEPWMARRFKSDLETAILNALPGFVEKVNRFFSKKIPGDFFQIRAFPESLFHLRSDDTMMPNMQEDREPFPRIFDDQWISPEHSSRILYTKKDEVTIYPFKQGGRILGSRIATSLTTGASLTGWSYGAFVLKPDVMRKGQYDLIMTKILSAISRFDARIASQSKVFVSEKDIQLLYPFLSGRELQEAAGHLVGSSVVILIIESRLSVNELFSRIKDIKGPRLMDRTYERLMEGRILDGSIRDLLPVPGEEDLYLSILPTLLARQKDPSIRFTDEAYAFYAQNLVHTPDNETELQGIFTLVGFTPVK